MGFFKHASFFLLLLLASCAKDVGYDVCGADEFVLDSYKIREGKFAILEMQGVLCQELDEDLLEVEKSPGSVFFSGIQCGQVEIDGKTRLYEVMAKISDVVQETNLFKSYVIRENQQIPVDLARLVDDGDMLQNIVMQQGDTIHLADKNSATLFIIEGELQQEITLPRGFLSLKSALAQAGKHPYPTDTPSIQILRGSLPKPKIYELSWEHVAELPTASLLLMPGDFVYVFSSPIDKFLRIGGCLFPGLAREKKTD